MTSNKLGTMQIRMGIWLIVAVAALNWGLVEFLDFNLITDGFSFAEGSTEFTATIGVITAAAAVNLYNQGVNLAGGK